eukprot:scaffold239590_cov28-Tisochrysis_lutea.AAC.3
MSSPSSWPVTNEGRASWQWRMMLSTTCGRRRKEVAAVKGEGVARETGVRVGLLTRGKDERRAMGPHQPIKLDHVDLLLLRQRARLGSLILERRHPGSFSLPPSLSPPSLSLSSSIRSLLSEFYHSLLSLIGWLAL